MGKILILKVPGVVTNLFNELGWVPLNSSSTVMWKVINNVVSLSTTAHVIQRGTRQFHPKKFVTFSHQLLAMFIITVLYQELWRSGMT